MIRMIVLVPNLLAENTRIFEPLFYGIEAFISGHKIYPIRLIKTR